MGIPFTQSVTEAAAITVLPRIDNTFAASVSNGAVVAAIIESSKGEFNRPTRVNKETFEELFGAPLDPAFTYTGGSKPANWQAMTMVNEALTEGEALVVRVAPSERATMPVFVLTDGDPKERIVDAPVLDVEDVANNYVTGDGEKALLSVYNSTEADTKALYRVTAVVYDGNGNEYEHLDDVTIAELVTLTFYVYTLDGNLARKEEYTGLPFTGYSDANGDSLYFHDQLNAAGSAFTLVINEDGLESLTESLATHLGGRFFDTGQHFGLEFTGNIRTSDYDAAIDLLESFSYDFDYIMGAGIEDPVTLVRLGELAKARLAQAYIDVPSGKRSVADAVQWQQGLGLKSDQLNLCWRPIEFLHTSGKRVVTGGSGAAVASKMRGRKNGTSVPAVHYSPAGQIRGYVNLPAPRSLVSLTATDKQLLAIARINPYELDINSGVATLTDALTMNYLPNDSRMVHVVDVFNYAERQFARVASLAQHEPDGITRDTIERGLTTVLRRMVAEGALVKPANPEVDGTEEFRLEIKRVEKDYWTVKMYLCVVGSSRRIAGQTIAVK